MASLLSSLVRANTVDDEKKVESPASIPPVQPPVAQTQPPVEQPQSIPPVAQPAQAKPQPAASPLGTFNIGGLTLNPADAFLKGVMKGPAAPAPGLPSVAPKVNTGITGTRETWDTKALVAEADSLSTFVGVQNKGRPKYGFEFLDTAGEWLSSQPDTGETTMSQSPIKAIVKQARELRNNPDPAAQQQARTYADALLYLSEATAKRDNEKANDAKRYLEQLSGYTTDDFKSPTVQRLVAGKQKTINAYAKPNLLAAPEMAKELDLANIKKQLVGTAVFDYVRDHFTDLTQTAQSGGPDADAAARTLSVFKNAFGETNAPVSEGTREARIKAFMGTPQGRALVNEAFSQLDGIGFFNQPKAIDLVTRTRKQIQAGQRSETVADLVTPEQIRDVFGPSRMKRQIRSAINISDAVSPETARGYEIQPDDEATKTKLYGGLSPRGVQALYGVDESGQPVGDIDLAQQEDSTYYDLSANVNDVTLQSAQTLRGASSSRISSRPALAGSLAAGMGLSTEQLTQAAQKLYTDPAQIKEFVNAGLSDYTMDADVVPKIEGDLRSLRLSKTGGVKTSGVSTNTFSVLNDAFRAITDVVPPERRSEWDNRRRIVNEVAVQARNLEGSALENTGSLFAKSTGGKLDYYQPLIPGREDQVGRIQVLQGMLEAARTDSGYRGELNKLIASAKSGNPYTGKIAIKPSEFKSLVGLYASRLETAASANKEGGIDSFYTRTLGIKPSELSKVDLKTALLDKLYSASPSRLGIIGRHLQIDTEGKQTFLPAVDAERLIENASAIPGDTGGKGGKSSRTERAAIGTLDASLSTVDKAFVAGRKAILDFANAEGNTGVTQKSFAIGVSNAFKKAITDSMAGVTMSTADRQKFLTSVDSVVQDLKDASYTEWMRGTVTNADVDDILVKHTNRLRIYSAQKGKSVLNEADNRSAIKDGEARLREARLALGETPDQISASDKRNNQILDDYRKKMDPYAGFVESWQNNVLMRAGHADERIKAYEAQVDTLTERNAELMKLGKESSSEPFKDEVRKRIQTNLDSIKTFEGKIDAQKTLLKDFAKTYSSPPTNEEWMASQNKELSKAIASDAEREYFTKLNNKLQAKGFDSFTPEEKRWYYLANVRRFNANDANNIAVGKSRRLVFQSFLDSPAGTKYVMDEPRDDEGNILQPDMNYFVQKKDKDGKVIGSQLNPNVSFTYSWKKNAKTGRFDELKIIAEERQTTGNNQKRVVGKQHIITGVENSIVSAKNAVVDVNTALQKFDKDIESKTPGATFGDISNTATGQKRRGSKFSGVMRDIMTLSTQDEDKLSPQNKQNLQDLLGVAHDVLASNGVKDPKKYIDNVINVARRGKAADEFATVLRQQIANRIEAFTSASKGRVVTPQEIQRDLSQFFNVTDSDFDAATHTDADIELAKKAGITFRDIKDKSGNVLASVPPTDIVDTILTDVIKDKPNVRLTREGNIQDLRLSVAAKLNTYLDKLEQKITYSVDQNEIAAAATAKTQLLSVIKSVTDSTSKASINVALRKLKGQQFTDARNIVETWDQRKDLGFKDFFGKYKELQDKVNSGRGTDVDEKRLAILKEQGNKWFKANGPSIGADPMQIMYDYTTRRSQAAAAQTALGKKQTNRFNIWFGERALNYVRYDIPRVASADNIDDDHYKAWVKKLSTKDKERLKREKEFGTQLGLDSSKYTFGRGVWADIFSRYDKMSPNQWIDWVYGANVDPAERTRLFAEFPAYSDRRNDAALQSEADARKPKTLAGENSTIYRPTNIDAAQWMLGITNNGYVVPVKRETLDKRLPADIERADNPKSQNFYRALFYKIDNNLSAYRDVLLDSQTDRVYTYTKDGKTFSGKLGDIMVKDSGIGNADYEIKPGIKVTGWKESYVDIDGEKITREFTGDHIKHGTLAIEPWNIEKRLRTSNIGNKIAVDPSKIKKAIEPPFPDYGKKAVSDFPLKQGDRLGFRVNGEDFWIGRKDYLDILDQIRSGKLRTGNVREITAELVSKVRINAARLKEEGLYGHTARPGFATDITAKVQSYGVPASVPIPEDVQDKIIKEAESAGWHGITKSGAKKGTIAFLMALFGIVRDEYLAGRREGREQRGL